MEKKVGCEGEREQEENLKKEKKQIMKMMILTKNFVELEVEEEVGCEDEREEENYKERKEVKTVVRVTALTKRGVGRRTVSLHVP